MIELTIDSRESALLNSITERDLDTYQDKMQIKSQPLELGDITIKYDSNDNIDNIFLVFERKTVADLIASIKDGRYKEQKARLFASYQRSQITYIIEGDNALASQSYAKNSTNMLLGAYYHSMFRDNIRIIFVKNISETTTFLLSLAVKILDNPAKFLNPNQEECNTSYSDTLKLKSKKIDNIDPAVCYIMQLSQIPHISNTIAKNIASVYPSMKKLIDSISALDTTEERMKVLCSIDKIGKEKAKNILQYMSLE